VIGDRFKVGDRVVFQPGTKAEARGTITRPHQDFPHTWWAKWEAASYKYSPAEMYCLETSMELESVADSPLYKALL
jgi:hypothetical protein